MLQRQACFVEDERKFSAFPGRRSNSHCVTSPHISALLLLRDSDPLPVLRSGVSCLASNAHDVHSPQQRLENKSTSQSCVMATLHNHNHNPQASGLAVILDTNFLLAHLPWLSLLSKAANQFQISLVVPWVVITELDSLKTRVRSAASSPHATPGFLLWHPGRT